VSGHRVWLIDASIYIFRAWFSLPDRWHTNHGMPLNAVYGYTRFLLDLMEGVYPSRHIAAAFDESLGSCFRNDIYPDYKASRELPDEALAFQLDSCRQVTELLGLPCFGGSRFEADDYIAALSEVAHRSGMPVTIVTRDKDLGQLLSHPDDHWWDFAADRRLDIAAFSERFSVHPAQFADYLALVGDPVDDIPGVPGVGPKSAAALLARYQTLESLGASLDTVSGLPLRGAAGIARRLQEHWEQVLLSRKLTGLAITVPGVDSVPESVTQAEHYHQLAEQLSDWGLPGALQARCLKAADRHAS
jgi:5'-3' exonuclease